MNVSPRFRGRPGHGSKVSSHAVFTAVAVALVAGPTPSHVARAAPAESDAPAAVAPVIRTVMDLIANRVHASSHREGHLVVEAAAPDFLKYVDGGWKTGWILGGKDGGDEAALVAGLSAHVHLPLDGDGDGAGAAASGAPVDGVLAFTVRSLAPAQKVSVFVNEKAVGTLDVAGERKRYQLAVPAATLQTGENKVRFTFKAAAGTGPKRSAAAFTDITLGSVAAGTPPEPVGARVREVAFGGVRKRAVSIAGKGSRLSYYVQAPEGASLAVSYGAETAGARAIIRVAVDGQAPKQLLEAAAGTQWTDATLPLGGAAGRAARIDLVSRGGAVQWAEPRIVLKTEPAPQVPRGPKLDHVFVWLVDTLRADKVRVYNPKTRVETPSYDAFAADATRFEWAQVPGTWSLPSHASLLTGVYPTIHKATAHEARLSKDVSFVAEVLKSKGFKTAIFSSNGYISAKWGFDRGWDMYRNFIRESLPNGADYVWKTAKPWILENAKRPSFAYVAIVEPHVIYNPKPEFLKKYWKGPYKGPIKPTQSGVQLGFIKSGKLKIDDNDRAYLEALHDGEITQSDVAFATFIADLKAAGLYDRSAIIVTSDHGDEFNEHGGLGHGHSVYQELTRVPLIIRAPGRMPQGKVVHADVEIMDVYSTILDLAGQTPAPGIQGTSLVPLSWDSAVASPRAALSIDGQVARGLKVERYRLVANAGRLELYDEIEDRLEQKNIAADRPIALRQMRSVLGLLHPNESRWSKTRWGTAANITPEAAKDLGL